MNSEQTDVEYEEIDLRYKNLLSWQNIWIADRLQKIQKKNQPIKKKFFVEESVIFTFPYETKRNHVTEPSAVGHVISERHWKKTFNFIENCKQIQIEARNSMPNCGIYFQVYSETIQTFENIFIAWSQELQIEVTVKKIGC